MFIPSILLTLLALTSASASASVIDRRTEGPPIKHFKLPNGNQCLAYAVDLQGGLGTQDCSLGGLEGENSKWIMGDGRFRLKSNPQYYITPIDVTATDKEIKLDKFTQDVQELTTTAEGRIVLEATRDATNGLKLQCLSFVQEGDKQVVKSRDCASGTEPANSEVKQVFEIKDV